MDRNQGQDGQYAGWNHASAGGAPAPRQPANGAFKPLSPVRPLTAYRPNEPYPACDRQDAPGPDNRPPAYPPQNGTYTPQGTPLTQPSPWQGQPPQNGSYPPPQGTPPIQSNPWQGQPLQNGTYAPPQSMPPMQPSPWQGQPPQHNEYVPQGVPPMQSSPWQGQPLQHNEYVPQGVPPMQSNPWQGQPPQHGEHTPQHGAPPQPAWLPEHVTPEEAEQPVRRTYLQPVPQTAPPEWRTAPPAPQPLEAAAPSPEPPVPEARHEPPLPADEPKPRTPLPVPTVPPTPDVSAALWPPRDAAPRDDTPDDDADIPDEAAPPRPAEPVTVPTFGYQPPRRGGGRRVLRPLLLTLAVLAAVIAALYFTGVLGTLPGLLQGMLSPKAQSGVPAVFDAPAAGAAAGVAPAAKAPVPTLSSFAVSPQSAVAPATLTFTLVTNAAADSIRLMNGQSALIPAEVSKAPQGDGYLWTAQAAFDAPYTGQARAYLRGADGQWHACEPAVSVEVR